MTLADEIREYVFTHYVKPARERGEKEIVVRTGDIHDRMGLKSQMPAVCGAVGANKFQDDFNVRLIERKGPANGANVFFTFKIENIMSDLAKIQQKILDFRNERDWAQFHDPKNLAEALSIEAGELLENFLWKTTEQSRKLTEDQLKNVKEELADIFIFLTYLSDEYKIDLLKEVQQKIEKNEKKYPVNKAKGTAKKYTEL